MKKAIGAVTLILVLAAAGSAFAYGGSRGRGMCNPGIMGDNGAYGGPGMMRGMGGRGIWACGGGMMGGCACTGLPQASVEVPQEIRDKRVEMKKLRIDMQNEISRKPIDRSKIEAIQKKHSELGNEVSVWFLKQQLDAIEKLQK